MFTVSVSLLHSLLVYICTFSFPIASYRCFHVAVIRFVSCYHRISNMNTLYIMINKYSEFVQVAIEYSIDLSIGLSIGLYFAVGFSVQLESIRCLYNKIIT